MELFFVLLNCLVIPSFGSRFPDIDFNATALDSLRQTFVHGKSLDSLSLLDSDITNGLFEDNDCNIFKKCGHNTTHNFCCSFDQTCCTNKGCCKQGHQCCPGSSCCPFDTNCCGRYCCTGGSTCIDKVNGRCKEITSWDQRFPLSKEQKSNLKWYLIGVGVFVGISCLVCFVNGMKRCHAKYKETDEYRRRRKPKKIALAECYAVTEREVVTEVVAEVA